MQGLDLVELFVRPLEAAEVEYMISGSVATSIYGEPRATLDIDLAVFPNAAKLALFPSLYPEEDYYLPPMDVMQIECRRDVRGHFNIIHHGTGLKADIYPSRSHPYLPWALKNRRRIQYGSVPVWVVPPEYMVFMKLEFLREGKQLKHLRDTVGMIRYQKVDMDFIGSAVEELALTVEWEEVLKHIAH